MRRHLPPDCPDHPPPTLQAAINLFNAGSYFTCHELLEALWLDTRDPHRDLYQGVLQIGIGLLHLQRGNVNGARNLLQRGSELIQPFIPSCFGLDLDKLSRDARSVLNRLLAPGEAHRFLAEDAIQIVAR